MKKLPKILLTCLILFGLQFVPTETEAAHRGGGVDNGFGPGINNGGGNGNNGNGGGNGGNGGGGTAATGGAQGAPAPLLAASIFGQGIAFGGCVLAWRRRKLRLNRAPDNAIQ